ncbi:MAG TPA: peptidylprolyl isomerase [Bryobacteraceae bacterium]|nr:peptidylprolyl isomerase [Bryobacteraceae bacterium]
MKRSLSIALALSFSSLSWSQTAAPAPAQQGSSSAGQLKVRGPEATAEQEPNKVVATIEGNPITARQAADMLKNISPEQRRSAPSLASLLQQVYMIHKFADQATQLHLDQQQPWKEELAATRANILGNAYLSHLAQANSAPTPDPKQYYDSHPDEFQQIKLSGILIGFAPAGAPAQSGGVTRTEQQARTKAADIEKKLKSGTNLATLASTESDNKASASHAGDLGTVNLGDTNLPANIRTALASLQPGQVSDPVQVQNGFYIFKVESRTKVPFEQAREAIEKRIQTDRNQAVLKQQFEKYKIQVSDPDFFNSGTSAHAIPSLQRPPSPGTPRTQAHQ